MFSRRSFMLASLTLPALMLGTAVYAHANLISSVPADKSSVSAPATIQLSFSEKIVAPLSTATLTLTEMPGMTMAPTKVPVQTALSADEKGLVLTPGRKLIVGSYQVDWHVISSDTHVREGHISFQVK